MTTASSQSIPPDDDYRYAYMAGIITATIVAVLISWIRMYTRMYISHNVWWDDWVMFIATVSRHEIIPRIIHMRRRRPELSINSEI